MKKESNSKKDARRYSIKEGLFASGRLAFGDYYISPFAIAINISTPLIALLASISGLLGPLSQIKGSKLIKKRNRKRSVLKLIFMESFVWLLFILLALFYYYDVLSSFLPLFFILSFSLFIILTNMSYPLTFSWLGDLVDKRRRGRWFAKRSFLISVVSGTLAIISSFFLDYFKQKELVILGFSILFFFAFISRLLAWRAFKKVYDPKRKKKKDSELSFSDFMKNIIKNNLGKFSVYRTILVSSNAISASVIAVYFLRYLNFSYKTYMVIILSTGIYSIFALKFWGKFSDRYGNYVVLKICSFLIAIVPLLWILHSSPIYLILIPSLLSGISWPGFNLASSNFIYDNAPQEKREAVISYHNMLVGLGIFFGALFGAIFIKYSNINFVDPLIILFTISSFLSFFSLFLLIKVSEVRKVKKFKGLESIINFLKKESKKIVTEQIKDIIKIKRYITYK